MIQFKEGITWEELEPTIMNILKMTTSKEALRTKTVEPKKSYTDIDVQYPNQADLSENVFLPLLYYSFSKRNGQPYSMPDIKTIEAINNFIEHIKKVFSQPISQETYDLLKLM